eukprot:COSAG01_NODE_3665_length_5813_cov_11.013126_1_plen_84_part_00
MKWHCRLRSAPFATDLVTHTDFSITSIPRSEGASNASAGKKVTTDGARELVWREKTGFSYRYRREKIRKTGALVRACRYSYWI